jgi:hypothetical protein
MKERAVNDSPGHHLQASWHGAGGRGWCISKGSVGLVIYSGRDPMMDVRPGRLNQKGAAPEEAMTCGERAPTTSDGVHWATG